jgi:hypothetical protein
MAMLATFQSRSVGRLAPGCYIRSASSSVFLKRRKLADPTRMLQPNRKSQSNRMSQQWIFLKKKAIESKGANNKTPESSSIWSLPHPRVPVASRFLFQDGRLFEVQRVMDPDRPRSWFIGDTVQSGSPSMARRRVTV